LLKHDKLSSRYVGRSVNACRTDFRELFESVRLSKFIYYYTTDVAAELLLLLLMLVT